MANVPDSLFLRKVIESDEKLLFYWANDSEVRKWSFNKKLITSEDHKIWFTKKLNDPNVLMWIFEDHNSPAGMVRLEKKDNKVLLNYLIALESRGKGLASKMLKVAMKEVIRYWQNRKVFAYTLPDNIASIKSLEKASFDLVSSNNDKNCYVYKTDKN